MLSSNPHHCDGHSPFFVYHCPSNKVESNTRINKSPKIDS